MRKVLGSFVLAVMLTAMLAAMLAAISGRALAADMGVPYKAPPSYAPSYTAPFSWTGAYVGANLGGIWGTFDVNPATTDNLTGAVGLPGSASINNSSLIGGFQAGYNWQIGMWVLGLEQDYQFTGLKQTDAFGTPAGLFLPGDSIQVKTDYLGATRAKVGLAWERAMVYAAGGLETGMFDVTSSYVSRGAGGSPAQSFTDTNKLHFGFNVGAGVEFAVTNNIFIGAEYRYIDLGRETYNLGAFTPSGLPAQTVSSTVNLTASQVTARLNIKLGGLGLFGM
ncbi:MAG TPA: outer membrane beta-barrel protein [Xanthobacteraceae bacterium]|nr:outer membrane beta-barrel protein [Xanthobacteraceae bacterium]